MADRPRDIDTGDDIGVGPDAGSPPRMPRWVKVAAIIVGVLVVVFVVLQLFGVGGNHGPGRHISGAGTPPTSVMQGHPPPAG